MNDHSAGLPHQRSGTVHFVPTQGCQKCDQEMLEEFSGLIDIAIYSCSMILLKMVAVLIFPIPGLIVTG